MKKTVLALSAAAVCVASAAPVLAEGQNPMTAPVQISMQGEASMTVANDEAVILFSAESRRPDAVSASNDAAKRGNAAIEALKRFSDKIDVGTTGLSTNPVYTRAKEGEVSEIGAWEARETLRVTVRDVSVVSDVLAADFAAAGTGGVYADAAGLRRDAGGGHCGQHTSGGAAGDVRRQVRQGCVSGTVAGGGADAAVHDHHAAGAGTGEVPGLSFFCIIELKSGNQPFPDFIFTLGGDHGKTVSHRISTPQTSAIYSGRHPFRLHRSGQPSSCSAAVDTSQPKDSSV